MAKDISKPSPEKPSVTPEDLLNVDARLNGEVLPCMNKVAWAVFNAFPEAWQPEPTIIVEAPLEPVEETLQSAVVTDQLSAAYAALAAAQKAA